MQCSPEKDVIMKISLIEKVYSLIYIYLSGFYPV